MDGEVHSHHGCEYCQGCSGKAKRDSRQAAPKATKANSPPAASSMPARIDCRREMPNSGPTAAMTPT